MTDTEPLGPHTTVRIPTTLRTCTGGQSKVYGIGDTVDIVFKSIADSYPDLLPRVLDDDGLVRRFVAVFVGEDDIRDMQDLQTFVPEHAEITIIPAYAGG